jgi:single-strand DNA-binding protein
MPAPNTITVCGNLTADPELTATSSEIPKLRLRLAVSGRAWSAATSSWADRHDGFFTVVCWRDLARNAHRSVRKGDRVVVTGRLVHREFQVGEGESAETRAVTEIDADEVAPSLRFDIWTRAARPHATAPHPAAAADADATDATDAAADGDGSDVTAAA